MRKDPLIIMGLWSRRSSSTLKRAELALLALAKVRDCLEVQDVPLRDGNRLHCIICGSKEGPDLLLLHGLCGGGALFYGILAELAAVCRVYLVDLMGMGRSSRPPCNMASMKEAEAFFIGPLEEFCQVKRLSGFILMGHSFGGYVAGVYALAYPHRVRQLLFLSPIGVTLKPTSFSFEESLQDSGWTTKMYWRTLAYMWRKRVTPNCLLQLTGPLSGLLLSFYTKQRLAGMENSERKAVETYMEQICLLPSSGDCALVQLLEPGTYARQPLADRLCSLSMPMAFIYGENDWVSPQGGLQVRASVSTPVSLHIVPDAGHQLHMDNPTGLINAILLVLAHPSLSSSLSPSQVWLGK